MILALFTEVYKSAPDIKGFKILPIQPRNSQLKEGDKILRPYSGMCEGTERIKQQSGCVCVCMYV